jgi:hypothetical protein
MPGAKDGLLSLIAQHGALYSRPAMDTLALGQAPGFLVPPT